MDCSKFDQFVLVQFPLQGDEMYYYISGIHNKKLKQSHNHH